MRELTRDDLKNILYGCAILGTGGGGTLEDGFAMVDDAMGKGKRFRLVDFDELDNDAIVGTPYGCGAISPLTAEEREKYARLPEAEESFFVLAMQQMETFLGKQVDAVVSTELGAMNTASAFYCGAMADRLIVDADPAARSVPCLQHSTYYLNRIPMCPMSVMNRFGEGAVFTHVFDDERGEDMVRALAVVSQNMIAVMDHVNRAGVLKNAMIRGAITYAERLGKAFLEAKELGKDYVRAVAEAGGGKRMFRGVIESNDWETRDGYTFGDTVIRGTGEWEGHELRIWYQNENIMSWLDHSYYVTVPELICVFNDDAREPQMNPNGKTGTAVSVLALPAQAEWTTKRGLEVFGPQSFGYDMRFRPFCASSAKESS